MDLFSPATLSIRGDTGDLDHTTVRSRLFQDAFSDVGRMRSQISGRHRCADRLIRHRPQ